MHLTMLKLLIRQIVKTAIVKRETMNCFSITFQREPTVIQLLRIGEALEEATQAVNKRGYWYIRNRVKSTSLAWSRREIWSTAYNKDRKKHYFFIQSKL